MFTDSAAGAMRGAASVDLRAVFMMPSLSGSLEILEARETEARLALDVRGVAVDGVMMGVVVVVILLLPGLGGLGRVPAARGRAVALRVEPLSKAQRLAPDGLPSLTQHGRAGGAG